MFRARRAGCVAGRLPGSCERQVACNLRGPEPSQITINGAVAQALSSVDALRAANAPGFAVAADGTIAVRTGKLGIHDLKLIVVSLH